MTVADELSLGFEPRMRVLGVPVSVVNISTVAAKVMGWAKNGSVVRTLFVRDVNSLMQAVKDPQLRALHDDASLVVPDGMPLVWTGRQRGYANTIGRCAGADLVDWVCALSTSAQFSHYFYGGKPGVGEAMAERLQRIYPGLKVAGIYSPPMRGVLDLVGANEALDQEIDAIKASGASFVWVGISSPKQEFFMARAAARVDHGIFFGVGAAFDFHAGAVLRAPAWMRNHGFEWFHRLCSEPQRLWKRYLIIAPHFVLLLVCEALKRRFSRSRPEPLTPSPA